MRRREQLDQNPWAASNPHRFMATSREQVDGDKMEEKWQYRDHDVRRGRHSGACWRYTDVARNLAAVS